MCLETEATVKRKAQHTRKGGHGIRSSPCGGGGAAAKDWGCKGGEGGNSGEPGMLAMMGR